MNNNENINIQHTGCHIPDDAIFYHECGCGQPMDAPEKIATFNMDTQTLSIAVTGEL
jgi:hypothetical protein